MGKPTILIVDDEPANLALLAQFLQPHFQVRAAHSGGHALRVASSTPRPDLILLDVIMPGLDGYGVLQGLRQAPATRDIPVIFVTTLDDEVNEERGFSLGAVDYIAKPISPAIVLARVRAHLELKQARDRLNAQNAWLESEVARRVGENLLLQDVSLAVIAELVETRDSDTGDHIQRTQAYVETLARHLSGDARFAGQLGEHDLVNIVKAAPLHDIGKIGIPDQILLKPGKLTREEFEIIKGHSRIGGEAIRHAITKARARSANPDLEDRRGAIAVLEVGALIATHHHERWDGGGYPDGLAGEAIPLPARLMAVADVFDALTTRRVYKEAMDCAEAGELIQRNSGSQFDPDVVAAFAANRESFFDIAATLRPAAPRVAA